MTVAEEYAALVEGVGLVEPADRGLLALGGADRASYLQGLLSNDILALRPGTGCYATYLTPQGRMVTDLIVLELGDGLLLDLPIGTRAGVAEKLERFIFSEDVQVTDVTAERGLLELHGPDAARALSTAVEGVDRDTLVEFAEYETRALSIADQELVVAATRDLGTIGFRAYGTHAAIAALRDTLRDDDAVVPVQPSVVTIRRVETGRPKFGVDMDESTIPLEAGIEDRAISMTKGCYVGQEVIVRVLHRGHGRVARRLVGLRLTGASTQLPPPGAVLASGDEADVGHLTTVTRSPRLGPIALGYLRRELTEPGTIVEVRLDAVTMTAAVTALPFVAP